MQPLQICHDVRVMPEHAGPDHDTERRVRREAERAHVYASRKVRGCLGMVCALQVRLFRMCTRVPYMRCAGVRARRGRLHE